MYKNWHKSVLNTLQIADGGEMMWNTCEENIADNKFWYTVHPFYVEEEDFFVCLFLKTDF